MFEKEAEEIAEERAEEETETVDDCDYDGCSRSCARDYYYFGFKDGAEFGYNKAKEEDKWHYVKDGLPPIEKKSVGRSKLVLVLSKEMEMQYAQYVEKEKTWARGIIEISFEPYAWKEIVLPEEEE